jgi:serine/threonine protein phosphatase PrpC
MGVFDGHGWEGEVVSQVALTDLPQIISHNLFVALQKYRQENPQPDGDTHASVFDDDSLDELVKKILVDAFVEVDQVNIPRDQSGGCTASVVLQLDGRVYVANAGDSQSILVTYRPSDGSIHVPFVTREDKPHLEEELERIRGRGGIVTLPDDEDDTSRVWDAEERVGLAMSRSLGDHIHTAHGVIPHPLVDSFHLSEIKVQHSQVHPKKQNENNSKDNGKNDKDDNIGGACNVDEHDEVQVFAISATDGLMDYWNPLELATVIGKSTVGDSSDTNNQGSQEKKQHLLLAFKDVIFTAAQGWLEEMEGQYRDDIAIVACRLS